MLNHQLGPRTGMRITELLFGIIKMCKKIKSIHKYCIRKQINYDVTYLIGCKEDPYIPSHHKYRTDVCLKRPVDKGIIVIGQNPSYCQTVNNSPYNLDDTCWNTLNVKGTQSFNKFYILNTYSEINCNGKSFKNYSNDFFNIRKSFEFIDKHENLLIVLAFSRNRLPLDFCIKLMKYIKTNRLYCFFDGNKIIYHLSTRSIKGKANNIVLRKIIVIFSAI